MIFMLGGQYVCMFSVKIMGNTTTREHHGFCFSDTYSAAVRWLEEEVYGEFLVEITSMELFDTLPVVSQTTWENMKAELKEG